MLKPQIKLLLGIEIIIMLSFPILSLANDNSLGEYRTTSKEKKVSQQRTVAGGVRSYCQNLLKDGELSLIVPQKEIVHYTATKKPNLFFYSEVVPSIPLQFTLVNPNISEPLVQKPLLIKKPGYHQINLPQSIALERDTVYLWHIAIPCSDNPQIFQDVLTAAIEYIPLSRQVKTELRQTTSFLKKSEIYAREGFWYDALNMANQDSPKRDRYWQQLLSEISLKSF